MAQRTDFQWPNGCSAAVSLSYDDGLPHHMHQVVPALEARSLRATFYATPFRSIAHEPELWRRAAESGHEIGNHTLFHPCRKSPHHDWLDSGLDLKTYTPKRWTLELRAANILLSLVDGKQERTFGNTCCDNLIGPDDSATSVESLVLAHCAAARGQFTRRLVDPTDPNFGNLGHFGGDGRPAGDLIAEIETAVHEGKWVIYMIHGVGPEEHDLHIARSEHDRLLDWLAANRSRVWTVPVLDVVHHLRQT